MTKDRKKIMLVGGGTGGHVVPVFEVYKKLQQDNPELDIVVVGSGTEIEKHFFSDIPVYRIMPTGKLRRHWTVKNIRELILVLFGFCQALCLLLYHRPDVIFSKGGYVALPIIFWAKILNIPFVIHESDTEMGIGNKIGVSKAKKIFVAFPEHYYSKLPKERTVYSTPVIRKCSSINKEEAKGMFGFKDDKPVIFITGGSQGAAHINENIENILVDLLTHYNVIHQSGDFSYRKVKETKEKLPKELQSRYYLTNFLRVEGKADMMLRAMEVADLVIARAGATTIFELAAKGKPMILIPWKHASSDHQTRNARIVVDAGGAILISDDDLTPGLLLKKINECFANNREKMTVMSNNSRQLFPDDGLERICKTLLEMNERK